MPNKDKRALQEEVAATGLTPLEVMLKAMRHFVDMADETHDADRQASFLSSASDHAARAAPYIHAKLSNIEVAGPGGGAIHIHLTPKDAAL